jgi:hypothetical protein
MLRIVSLAAAGALFTAGLAMAADTPSVELGLHVSIVGGCHDCHTVGYNESAGQIDPMKALMGSPEGFEGPWGKTFAKNLRLAIKDMSEDDFVTFSDTFKAAPPMPWYNVHELTDLEARSLYQYIKSLPGGLGDPAPEAIPPKG